MNHFETELRDQLRRSEHDINPNTAGELSQIRSRALSHSSKDGYWWSQLTLPRTVALASVLAFSVVLYPTLIDSQRSSVPGANFLSSEGDDLYENIDFYLWMANSENNLAG